MNFDLSVIENQMPNFNSHEEARTWFKELFNNRFVLGMQDEKEGKKVYYYHLIKDPEVYERYMESFASSVTHEITNMETFKSYSTIEITENGKVSFTP